MFCFLYIHDKCSFTACTKCCYCDWYTMTPWYSCDKTTDDNTKVNTFLPLVQELILETYHLTLEFQIFIIFTCAWVESYAFSILPSFQHENYKSNLLTLTNITSDCLRISTPTRFLAIIAFPVKISLVGCDTAHFTETCCLHHCSRSSTLMIQATNTFEMSAHFPQITGW
jgi:hypothetical protein